MMQAEIPADGSAYLDFARDIFLVFYLSAGINFKDIATLRYCDMYCTKHTITETLLFFIKILHQTTTSPPLFMELSRLYLIIILHQTTTSGLISIDNVPLTNKYTPIKTRSGVPAKPV